MNFQLAPLNFSATAAQSTIKASTAFSDVGGSMYSNRISHDNGQIIVTMAGQEAYRTQNLNFVMAGFADGTFNQTRRQWYATAYNANNPATHKQKPSCASALGTAPDAGVPAPQAETCAACPKSKKDVTTGYTACGQRKTFILFLVNTAADGSAAVDTSTPFVLDASASVLFGKYNETTRSGGTHPMVQMVVGRGMSVEQVVWQLNFSQGAKSPVISPIGQLPDEVTLGLMQRAKEDDVAAMMAPRKQMAPQLSAPQAAPALAYAAPVQAAPVYQAPAPVQAAPVYQAPAPVQAAPVYQAPAPVQAAPVYQAPAPVQAAPVYQAPAPVQAAPVSMPQQTIPATNVPSPATRNAALSAFAGLLTPQGAA